MRLQSAYFLLNHPQGEFVHIIFSLFSVLLRFDTNKNVLDSICFLFPKFNKCSLHLTCDT